MKISKHADHTEELFNLRAEDIHKWIDGFFDKESFEAFLSAGIDDQYDPYDHRSFRHCQEALEEAYEEFKEKYTREEIKNVFETHLKDDYEGYLPQQSDFSDGAFTERFHESHHYSKNDKILTETELTEYFKNKSYPAKDETTIFLSSFNLRIIIPILFTYIIFVASVFIFLIPVYKSTVISRKKEMLKELISVAKGVAKKNIKKVSKEEITLEKAQEITKFELSELNYGVQGKDYFWITDMTPTMLMHPYREDLIGKDLSHYEDNKTKSGKLIFVELVHIVKEKGHGFLQYDWQWMDKPNIIVPKLSYVDAIPEWNWTIGTGIYLNDVEEEIHKLTDKITIIFIIISTLIFSILSYVIYQTKKIEKLRLRAEKGLREAKDRYRALVEASNEGHILLVEGEIVFSNITLQRMTGYSPEEITSKQFLKQLFHQVPRNEKILSQLKLIQKNEAPSIEIETQILTKSKHFLDIILSTSHIFLSRGKGTILSFRHITSNKNDSFKNTFQDEKTIIEEIKGSENTGHIIRMVNQMIFFIKKTATQKDPLDQVRYLTSHTYEIAVEQFIKLIIKEIGPPPVKFSFLSLGSMARKEMTLFSDQDNALVYETPPKEKQEKVKRYFLKLSKEISTKLDQAGYPFCPGNIMAMNPKWCLSLQEWKDQFKTWITTSDPQALLDIHVFFDLKNAYGEEGYTCELQHHITQLFSKYSNFLIYFTQSTLSREIPKGPLLNIKQCLTPIVNFARVYALKHDIQAPETILRLKQLKKKKNLKAESIDQIIQTFEQLWHFRFYNQLFAHADLRAVNDELSFEDLSSKDLKKLKDCLAHLKIIQSQLSYDILGIDIS